MINLTIALILGYLYLGFMAWFAFWLICPPGFFSVRKSIKMITLWPWALRHIINSINNGPSS